MQEEKASAKMINSRTVLAVGGVWDRDVVKDGKVGASGLELGSNDFD